MKIIDEGIFLHRTAYSDSSLIVTFYTRKSGLQKFVFKGGKKKAHHLFPMSLCEIEFFGRKEASLLNLTAAETANRLLTFQFNPMKSTVAFFMAEMVIKCVHSGDVDEGLFDFLESAIEELNNTDELRVFPIWFLLELSEKLGIRPLCEQEGDRVFNLDNGSFQPGESSLHRTLSGDAAKLIQCYLLKGEFPQNESKNTRQEGLKSLLEYYRIHIPKFDMAASYEIILELLK